MIRNFCYYFAQRNDTINFYRVTSTTINQNYHFFDYFMILLHNFLNELFGNIHRQHLSKSFSQYILNRFRKILIL